MIEKDFQLSSYNFDLPPEQIAQFPPKERGESRLLVVNRAKSELIHTSFSNLAEHLPKNSLLVANNSKVLPARLMSSRQTGGKVEFLLLTPLPKVLENAYVNNAQVKNAYVNNNTINNTINNSNDNNDNFPANNSNDKTNNSNDKTNNSNDKTNNSNDKNAHADNSYVHNDNAKKTYIDCDNAYAKNAYADNNNVANNTWNSAEVTCLLKAGGKFNEHEQINLGKNIKIKIISSTSFGQKKVILSWRGNLAEIFANEGHLPLPPYIKRADCASDHSRYQTIYANSDKIGSIAAPTAGLHFTKGLQDTLNTLGYKWSEVTLYVGYGTFSPVRSDDIREHSMHMEYFDISENTAQNIMLAKAQGHPIVAIGTTTVRTLEGAFQLCGEIKNYTGWTDIFLYPTKSLNVVDALVTNFHLPHSSLLMMVSAIIGRERLLEVYAEAVQNGYNFFSYGDAMLIK